MNFPEYPLVEAVKVYNNNFQNNPIKKHDHNCCPKRFEKRVTRMPIAQICSFKPTPFIVVREGRMQRLPKDF